MKLEPPWIEVDPWTGLHSRIFWCFTTDLMEFGKINNFFNSLVQSSYLVNSPNVGLGVIPSWNDWLNLVSDHLYQLALGSRTQNPACKHNILCPFGYFDFYWYCKLLITTLPGIEHWAGFSNCFRRVLNLAWPIISFMIVFTSCKRSYM